MRRTAVLLILLAIALAACAAPSYESTPTPPVVADSPEPSPAGDEAWITAYTDVLKSGEAPFMITLADVTQDGVPEMFFADIGTSNSWITRGYSYVGGEVKDITLPDDFLPSTLERYRDKSGGTLWLASHVARNGAAEYDHEWYECDFSQLSAVVTKPVFGWIERGGEDDAIEYLLYGDDGRGSYDDATAHSFDEVDARQTEFFLEYELLDTNSVYAIISDYIIGYDGSQTELSDDNLDAKKIEAYFKGWQTNKAGGPGNREPYTSPEQD